VRLFFCTADGTPIGNSAISAVRINVARLTLTHRVVAALMYQL